MNRLLLTVGQKKCPFGCAYCFADFTQYQAPHSLDEAVRGELDLTDIDVIYPACDVDLFALQKHWKMVLEKAAELGRSISVSTKAALTRAQIDGISCLAEAGRASGCVIKVSASASTMYSCAELEPRAAGWDERLENLARLFDAGVTSCLVLKPVLAEVPTAEYREMLTQAAAVTAAVVLGDEYVDDDQRRRRPSSAGAADQLSSRQVGWIDGNPHWLVRDSRTRLELLGEHARTVGLMPYFSDLHFMERAILAQRQPARQLV
jgi:DNA repair photolyase